MKKVRCLLSMFLFLIIAGYSIQTPVYAQDTVKLTLGEIASGALTAASNVMFTFSGKKDEYTIITFTSAGEERASADLTLLDSSGKKLAESRGLIGSTTIFAQLPADGDYTVQLKGKVSAGKDGVYAMQLLPVKVLTVGEKAEAEVTSRIVVDEGKQVPSAAYFLAKSNNDFKLTTLLGEREIPANIQPNLAFNISQLKITGTGMNNVFQASGSSVPGFSVMLLASPQYYLLEIGFNGFSTVGNQSKDAVLSHKFTVMAEAM